MAKHAIVVGGGIAGASVAVRLATAEHDVTLLERESVFTDRIRGEGMGAWGFEQVAQLGLVDVLLAVKNVNVTSRMIQYDETVSIEDAEKGGR